MIFSVQRYLEDYFHKRGLVDDDQYAVKLANLYGGSRLDASEESFRARMSRVRTAFFRRNPKLARTEFEGQLLKLLDKTFPRGGRNPAFDSFPGGIARERSRLRSSRRSVRALLMEFRSAVEARAIDYFWESRERNKLRAKPETIAQGLLAIFITGALRNRGIVQREVRSGIGYVDVQVIFGRAPHLIELKVLKGSLEGVEQLAEYMRLERRPEGWLVLVDARPAKNKKPLPETLAVKGGTVRVLAIDVNPVPPSARRPKKGD